MRVGSWAVLMSGHETTQLVELDNVPSECVGALARHSCGSSNPTGFVVSGIAGAGV